MNRFMEDAKFPKTTAGILFLVGCLLYLVQASYGNGFVFGALLSMALFLENIHYYNQVVDIGTHKPSQSIGHTFLHGGLMFLGMYLCVRFETISNLYTFTLGLFFVKLSYFVASLHD